MILSDNMTTNEQIEIKRNENMTNENKIEINRIEPENSTCPYCGHEISENMPKNLHAKCMEQAMQEHKYKILKE